MLTNASSPVADMEAAAKRLLDSAKDGSILALGKIGGVTEFAKAVSRRRDSAALAKSFCSFVAAAGRERPPGLKLPDQLIARTLAASLSTHQSTRDVVLLCCDALHALLSTWSFPSHAVAPGTLISTLMTYSDDSQVCSSALGALAAAMYKLTKLQLFAFEGIPCCLLRCPTTTYRG